jgi:hypothetical protein
MQSNTPLGENTVYAAIDDVPPELEKSTLMRKIFLFLKLKLQ